MSGSNSVRLAPITAGDLDRVARFLHAHLNRRVSRESWLHAMVPPWPADAPNHGFLLEHGSRVVGVHLAFYSIRTIANRPERFCNLAAWCVLEDYRSHGIRLLRALLNQRGYHFTDLSPSGNVVPLNKRLGFRSIEPRTALVANLPSLARFAGARVVADPGLIEQRLSGDDLAIFKDHARAPAACHLVLVRGREHCYIISRKDTRKGLPLFATILYVGNRPLFREHSNVVRMHLLRRGALATLSEERVVGYIPRFSLPLSRPRPKMYRSNTLTDEDIDYLYSELTCVAW